MSDTAQSGPKQTKNILVDQPVYTVSNMEDKIKAIKGGIGIGAISRDSIKQELALGTLVELGIGREVDILLAWQRAEMGRAKAWCLQHIYKLWQQKA